MTQCGDKISYDVSFLYTLLLGSHGTVKQFINEQNELNFMIDSAFASVEWNIALRPIEASVAPAKTVVGKFKAAMTGWF